MDLGHLEQGWKSAFWPAWQLIQGSPTNRECHPAQWHGQLLKFSVSLQVKGRENLPPKRLFGDWKMMARALTSFRSLLTCQLLRKASWATLWNPSLLPALSSFPALCYFCFCWGLLQISVSHIFLCVFSGPPGRLAYPFIHWKLSLLWATRMLEKTNDMTSKIRNQDNGTVQKP